MKTKEIKQEAISDTEPRHPIQIVSRRTGLTADVIRIWERRYGVVSPARVGGGRRVYSDNDIYRLSLLQKVTGAGRRISDVAEFDNQALLELVNEDTQLTDPALGPGALQGVSNYLDQALQAVKAMDAAKLRKVIATAGRDLPLNIFLEQVLAPLLRQIGSAWQSGEVRVGHEHLSSKVIQQHLLGMLKLSNEQGSTVIFATPAGYQHELGILIAAITAESEGWLPVYLGADLPAAEIAAAAQQRNARMVALGLQSATLESGVVDELQRLLLALPEVTTLVLGGPGAVQNRVQLESLPAVVIDDLAEFRRLLEGLPGSL